MAQYAYIMKNLIEKHVKTLYLAGLNSSFSTSGDWKSDIKKYEVYNNYRDFFDMD